MPPSVLRRRGPLLALVLLAACTGTRDPSQAGFFDGIRNIATGAYEQDTAHMRADAASAELRAQQLRDDNAKLQLELARLNTEDKALRQRQQHLNSQVAGQLEALQRARSAKAASTQTLDALQKRLDAAEAKQHELSQLPADQIDPAEIHRLETENAALRQDIDKVLAAMPQ